MFSASKTKLAPFSISIWKILKNYLSRAINIAILPPRSILAWVIISILMPYSSADRTRHQSSPACCWVRLQVDAPHFYYRGQAWHRILAATWRAAAVPCGRQQWEAFTYLNKRLVTVLAVGVSLVPSIGWLDTWAASACTRRCAPPAGSALSTGTMRSLAGSDLSWDGKGASRLTPSRSWLPPSQITPPLRSLASLSCSLHLYSYNGSFSNSSNIITPRTFLYAPYSAIVPFI